ncbi:cytochrome c biogenesis heme-transporting ATPase CcmA [Alteromonas oceanisediminis]|uniref:cytochrome c biogenesis heme-transporting ATPase CcmA n=1 Tax=Alteromonas oceanisediminis TaxID=2836180 RepID=UPI001BDAAC36|nr:cytochrome c biogenesis heme-transporting ATPase CcmA [Alteromonas oceanisediminis]MBT0585077.1 cytochrome c biogenesis heme-transporting ATPase CcmA [Alteromonas oceanisediminis]
MSQLQAIDLTCIRRDRALFSGVSFDLEPSELVLLSGLNGAGKTSLLRILTGFIRPDEGRVMWQGESITNDITRRAFAQQLVYIGHKSAVNPLASALENCVYWCEQQQLTTPPSVIFDVLTTLGLVGLEDVPCGQLSAGQNRRVALARLWFKQSATVWILDEPFTALDVAGIALIEQHITAFCAGGGSVIMTSHQPLVSITQWRDITLEYRI